jgi:hypothetical protein
MKTLEQRLYEAQHRRPLDVASVCVQMLDWLRNHEDAQWESGDQGRMIAAYLRSLMLNEVFDLRPPEIVGEEAHSFRKLPPAERG